MRKDHCAVKLCCGVNEGWGDYYLIDNDESRYKEPAHGKIEELEKGIIDRKKRVGRGMERGEVEGRGKERDGRA